MSFFVFAARRRLDNFAGCLFDATFYDSMSVVFEDDLWKSFDHEVTGKEYSFASIDEFLTSDDGLGIQELDLFLQCVDLVASSDAKIAGSAKEFLNQLSEVKLIGASK